MRIKKKGRYVDKLQIDFGISINMDNRHVADIKQTYPQKFETPKKKSAPPEHIEYFFIGPLNQQVYARTRKRFLLLSKKK